MPGRLPGVYRSVGIPFLNKERPVAVDEQLPVRALKDAERRRAAAVRSEPELVVIFRIPLSVRRRERRRVLVHGLKRPAPLHRKARRIAVHRARRARHREAIAVSLHLLCRRRRRVALRRRAAPVRDVRPCASVIRAHLPLVGETGLGLLKRRRKRRRLPKARHRVLRVGRELHAHHPDRDLGERARVVRHLVRVYLLVKDLQGIEPLRQVRRDRHADAAARSGGALSLSVVRCLPRRVHEDCGDPLACPGLCARIGEAERPACSRHRLFRLIRHREGAALIEDRRLPLPRRVVIRHCCEACRALSARGGGDEQDSRLVQVHRGCKA